MLDRWHLADARRRARRRAVPDEAERAAGTARVEACLEMGDVAGATAALAALAAQAPDPAVPAFLAFLTAQAPRIPDDAARRAAGLPIGRGGVEKGVDVAVNRRCKGRRGLPWWRARADGVLALRVAELNDEWAHRLPRALALTG